MEQPRTKSTQSGMALILVLWIVAALAIFASSLGGVVRQEAAVGGVTRQMIEGRAVGEAAIYQVLQRMAVKPTEFREFGSVSIPLGGKIVEVDIVPWTGLININGAPPALLSGLLVQAAGMGRGAADELAQAIVQARSGPGGQTLQRSPWEAPEDLLQVPGMTYAIFSGLRDFVVADAGGRSGLNPAAAPDVLRNWLESADAAAPFRQSVSGPRYSLVARVPFEGSGVAQITMQVFVQGGMGGGRLPWAVLSASQAWRGRM